ncbi:thioredoxin family protein [Streptomyces canus]|uniref:thioredoxin family protein n=1 Tax=Streptomyces canus TaxID=58343 RepID=UPI0036E92063
MKDWNDDHALESVPSEAIARHLYDPCASAVEREIVKRNIDENPATAAKYGVMSIPTTNVHVGGEVVVAGSPSPLLGVGTLGSSGVRTAPA